MVKLIKDNELYIYDDYDEPEWVENLNSVLDGNILLTLYNKKKLSIPLNITKYIYSEISL